MSAATDPAVVVLAHLGEGSPALLVGAPIVLLIVFGLLERRARARERDDKNDDG